MEERLGTQYDRANYDTLMNEYGRLTTFAEVNSWDARAQTEVERIVPVLRELDNEITRQSRTLEDEKRARLEKPFLKRLFSSRGREESTALLIKRLGEYREVLDTMATKMQETIDFTPNSPREQKVLLNELRERKKHLQIKKRELAANIREIRQEARQMSANAGEGFLGTYSASLAASQRRELRFERDEAMRPYEDEKSAVERQILQIDKDILWAERLKG